MRGVVGLVFELGADELQALSRLAGRPLVDNTLTIGGVTVLAAEGGTPHGPFPLRVVVLKADGLDAFSAHVPSAEATSVMGRPALRIGTNPLAWDLLVTV